MCIMAVTLIWGVTSRMYSSTAVSKYLRLTFSQPFASINRVTNTRGLLYASKVNTHTRAQNANIHVETDVRVCVAFAVNYISSDGE